MIVDCSGLIHVCFMLEYSSHLARPFVAYARTHSYLTQFVIECLRIIIYQPTCIQLSTLNGGKHSLTHYIYTLDRGQDVNTEQGYLFWDLTLTDEAE